MNKSTLIKSALALTLFLSSASTVYAGGTPNDCQPIYGGGDPCQTIKQIEINKTVQNPNTKIFVDGLSSNDPKFAPNQIVSFKLTIRNISGINLSNIVIKDILPDYVDFSSGIGNFDTNNKTLTINLEKLDFQETRDFFIQAKVKSPDKLGTQKETCVINQSIVIVNDKWSQDNSGFCIDKNASASVEANSVSSATTKGGLPLAPTATPANPKTTKGGLPVYPPTKAKTTPETGPEALSLIGLIPTALGGIFLRKKTKFN